MKRLFLLCFLAIILSSMTVFKPKPQPLNAKWTLIQMPNYTKQELVQSPIILDVTDARNPILHTGCNELQMMAQFSKKGIFKVAKMSIPENGCEGREKEIEEQLIAYFKESKSYILHGKYLVIQTQSSKELLFVVHES